MQIQTIALEDCYDLLDDWQHLAHCDSNGVNSPGASNSFDWVQTLYTQHPLGNKARVMVVEEGNKIVGIIPTYLQTKSKFGLHEQNLTQIQDFYSTRGHLLIQNNTPELLILLFNNLKLNHKNWHTFSFTTVTDSENDRAVRQSIVKSGLKYKSEIISESPYLDLPDSVSTLLASRDKKFRYTIRSGTKKLEDIGELHFEVFKKDAQAFLQHVYEIERNSWKELAGTSITKNPYQKKFYELYTPKAADNNQLNGGILFLNGNPICYNFGICFNQVYECLKTSYKESHKQYNPGHITYLRTFEHIINRGIRSFDFQGVKEQSKLKWTRSSYTQNRYTIYNTSAKSTLFFLARKLMRHTNSDTK